MDAVAPRMGNLATKRPARSDDQAEPRAGLAARVASINPVLRQPNTWTGALVLTLAAAVVWQHPIAQRLGTSAPHEAAATAAPATADVAVTSNAAPLVPASHPNAKPVVEHAPRDPFRPLVAPNGAARSPVTIRLPHAVRPVSGPQPTGGQHSPSAGSAGGRCAAVHVVRAGDSLWSISEHNLAKLGYRTVTPAWHAVYAANQKAIGSSPGSLSVGTKLCLPSA